MSLNNYLKNLNLSNETLYQLENICFLEDYSVGDEIFNPNSLINKFSIIISGSVRQVIKDSFKNTNIYKYVKDDLLFVPELIYNITNPYFYIASTDLKLISFEKENFLNLISENNEFLKWINNQIFKNEKISILQKLFREKFNNTLNKEKLLEKLSENIRIVDLKVFKDIQEGNIQPKNSTIYSISKSSNFDYLEQISFSKILDLKFEEIKKIVIIDNKFINLKIDNNKISKIERTSPIEEEFSDNPNEDFNYADIKIKNNIFTNKNNVLE